MRLVLLVLLWAVPLSAGTQWIAAEGEIAAPRFGEGDLDGDGRLELVVGGRVGPFRPVTDPLAGRRARVEVHIMEQGQLRGIAGNDELPVVEDLAVGDIDGDGRAEILAVGWYRLWTLRLEEGELVVVGEEALATGRFSRVDAADLDGDGRAEVVVAESLREPGAEVVTTAISVYSFEGQWQQVARLDLEGDVGDLCLGELSKGQPSMALELGGEEVGGLVRLYDFNGFAPQLRHSQQVTKDHVRALNLELRRLAGRSLLAVGDIRGRIALLEPRGGKLVEAAIVAAPPGPLRGLHLTRLFDREGIQLLGSSGMRGAVWMADGF
jgi:hypothetical protein